MLATAASASTSARIATRVTRRSPLPRSTPSATLKAISPSCWRMSVSICTSGGKVAQVEKRLTIGFGNALPGPLGRPDVERSAISLLHRAFTCSCVCQRAVSEHAKGTHVADASRVVPRTPKDRDRLRVQGLPRVHVRASAHDVGS